MQVIQFDEAKGRILEERKKRKEEEKKDPFKVLQSRNKARKDREARDRKASNDRVIASLKKNEKEKTL